MRKSRFAVGGRVDGLRTPTHYDSTVLLPTPAECRAEIERLGWRKVVAFQTRIPLHRAHFDLPRKAMLDGELVRRNLSPELGFSREHCDLSVKRIGFVASEITDNRGVAICAPIAPYDAARMEVRQMATASGGSFVLVHVATPLAVCERRDAKGRYAKARAGKLPQFTGISDPYEVPEDAELTIDMSERLPGEAAERVVAELRRRGELSPTETGAADRVRNS